MRRETRDMGERRETRDARRVSCLMSLVILAVLPLCAAMHEAKDARELLVLDGDQTGNTIKIADGYLPESWNVATAIYAKGKPKFVLPPHYRVASEGEGWWAIGRRREPTVFTWTGEGGDDKWENPGNWGTGNGLVPGRLDTVKLVKDAMIDMGRDRMVSNLWFSAKVILAGGAIHAQNTVGRGAKGKLGIRAGSSLGTVKTTEGAIVAPLRGKAGYKGVVEESAMDGFSRVVLTRPPASYEWSGAAGDGAWDNVKNWLVNGRVPIEPPTVIDQAVFKGQGLRAKGQRDGAKDQWDEAKGEGGIVVRLPDGWSGVSNLVMEASVVWKGGKMKDALGESGGNSSLDIYDLTGNKSFIIRGKDATICIRGASDIPIVVERGATLAIAAHDSKSYRSITLQDGATLVPYDWVVEINRLSLKGENTIRFWPPRHFNRWRPIWVIHAKHLEGKPNLVTDDMTHWRQNVESWKDGSSMITINWK